MQKSLLTILLLSILLPTLWAADTLTIEQKVQHTLMPSEWIRTQIWQNPAINYYYRNFGLSSMSLNGFYEKRGDAALVQQGNGNQYGNIYVESFLPISEKSRVFGEAKYKNGKKRNIIWNENDDCELLYPYFTGDSIGGDLQGEEYYFMGGYAHEFGEWTLGLKLAYRATITYRKKDPRPKNTVSDLNAAIAIARRISNKYRLGFSVNVQNYDQKSEIDFYADKGSTSVYHLLGLGMNYVRFTGTQFDSSYDGWGIGGSFDLLPYNDSGLSASLTGNYFTFTKELTNLNYAPIVDMDKLAVTLETAWLRKIRSYEYGIKLNGSFENHDGTENIFGDPTAGVYPVISSISSYTNQVLNTSLAAVVARNPELGMIGWTVMPYGNYYWTKSEYKNASRSMEIANACLGVDANIMFKAKKMLFRVGANLSYLTNLTDDSMFNGINREKSIDQSLLADFAYLSDNNYSVNTNIRGDYFLKNNNNAIFFTAGWLHQQYSNSGNTNRWQASVGFVF